ncbi:MAG: hypothetical protein J4G09_07870 [Proteobacteria bacterium]|nr:hypothetical protein [Pseudomonadota bacterium]
MAPTALQSARYEAQDFDAAQEMFFERGWTDGLPIVPPTEDRVGAFIEAAGRPPGEIVAHYPTRRRHVSVEKVAINAVMAGCRPEYFPVVLAIVEAIATEPFGIHACNATTGGSAIGFVVNGPIRNQLGMNYRGNVFGPGNRANSTIGRAVRLTQINAMGSVPGAGAEAEAVRPVLDRATLGQPGKYAGYHLPENEEDFPSLRPLHVELGYAPEQSVVTAFATGGHIQFSAHAEPTAAEICATLSHFLVGTGKLSRYGWCVLVIPPENAEIFARDGWSKADIRGAIFEGTTRSAAWAKRNGWPTGGSPIDRRGGEVEPGDEERSLAIAAKPENILVVIAGGTAGAFVHALLPYGGQVSKVIRTTGESK